MNPNSRARLKSRLRDATRAAIVDAAEEEFGRAGASLARMEDIASNAGLSVGTLYKHFADREAILEAVYVARSQELLTRIDQSLAAAGGKPFEARVEAFLRAILSHYDDHRPFFAMLVEQESIRPDKRTALAGMLDRAQRLIEVGERSVHAPLRREDSELFAMLLIGLCRSAINVEKLKKVKRAEPLADRAPALARFFLEGAGRR